MSAPRFPVKVHLSLDGPRGISNERTPRARQWYYKWKQDDRSVRRARRERLRAEIARAPDRAPRRRVIVVKGVVKPTCLSVQ